MVSQGVATCEQEPFLGGYAIFAGAETCATGGAVELDLSGSTKTVNGGIFSNGDLKITGSDANVTGSIEYRGNLNTNESDVAANAEKYFGSAKEYPLDLEIDEFRAAAVPGPQAPTSTLLRASASTTAGWSPTVMPPGTTRAS